jgi:polyhydroxybutyrate depolymerase
VSCTSARSVALLLAVACAHRAGWREGTFTVDSVERTYGWVGDPTAQKRPLVIALHGRGGRGEGQARLSHLDEIASREGFLAVFPDGVNRSWADPRNKTPASKQGVDDVAFLGALIDELVADGRADPARIYVTGMSNGAVMTWTLACALGDRIAAIAPVAGGMPADMPCDAHTPVLYFAGDHDPILAYAGGEGLLGAEDSVHRWAAQDGCAGEPAREELTDVDPDDETIARAERWESCANGAAVELVTIQGGGHTWPGGQQYASTIIIGKTSRDVDASEEMWRFFRRFHR